MRAVAQWLGPVLVLGIALVLSLAFGHAVLGLPAADLPEIGLLMAQAAAVTWIGALLILHPPILQRFGGLRWQVALASLVGSLLLLALLLAVTQAMFISSNHDLPLLLTLLLFAAVFAGTFSIRLGHVLTQRIRDLRQGTARLAAGELAARLHVIGRDELAALTTDFNEMADALAHASARQRELEQARRDLVAAVSHDLRTPIASVRALVEALEDRLVTDEATVSRYLHNARTELERLSQLVDDLFELAQIDAGLLRIELERASIHDLVSDVLSTMRPRAEQHGIHLIGEVDARIDAVLMSPLRIQRVLYNLVSNALRHTPADGTICVRVSAQEQDDEVRVEVQDTGEGITTDDVSRIFEWSYRGEKSRSRDFGGAGIGLAIARGLVEAHGGRIWVESAPGHGSCFAFTLRRV